MKKIVVYYSHTGNTKKVADVLAKSAGAERVCRLEALDEADSFFGQCRRAFFRRRAKITDSLVDVGRYDLICLGTPVWAFGPAPAIWTYLDQCAGLAGKKAVVFATYGSGAGKEKCLDLMENALKKKGVIRVERFSIQQAKVTDNEFVKKELAQLSFQQ